MKNKKCNIHGGGAASSAQSTNWFMQYTQYHLRQGHGWAAEDANAMADRLAGKNVDQVGASNILNGADRISNGVKIQTKYCATAKASIEAAFDNNGYRYYGMKLEVPSDQYEEAVKFMAEKIRNGKLNGITDPAMAKDVVLKGNCTYKEACRTAKAGNIDSIKFDIKTQSITCALTCGFSFVVNYTNALRQGKSQGEALKIASKQSVCSGGTALLVGVSTQQLLRTTVGRRATAIATNASRKIVDVTYSSRAGKSIIEKSASRIIGKTLAGNAAKNVVVRGMRTNMVTGSVMLAAQTIPDAVRLGRGKISKREFCENVSSNAAGIGAGYVGATIGASFGSCVPVVGTIAGGFVGGVIGSVIGSGTVRKAWAYLK